jgi:hypothetical protein
MRCRWVSGWGGFLAATRARLGRAGLHANCRPDRPPVHQPHTNGDGNIPRDEFKRALKPAGNDVRKVKVPETQQ